MTGVREKMFIIYSIDTRKIYHKFYKKKRLIIQKKYVMVQLSFCLENIKVKTPSIIQHRNYLQPSQKFKEILDFFLLFKTFYM